MNATYASHALFLLHRDAHIAAMRRELAADHGYQRPAPTDEEAER